MILARCEEAFTAEFSCSVKAFSSSCRFSFMDFAMSEVAKARSFKLES